MSWINGINLTDSISSLKSQISTFTHDILSEEEFDDSGVEVAVPKWKVRDWEVLINHQKQEIEQLTKAKEELGEQLQICECRFMQDLKRTEAKLQEKNVEVDKLKEEFKEWKWQEEAQEQNDSLSGVNFERSSGAGKVRALEQELDRARESHRQEVSQLLEQLKEQQEGVWQGRISKEGNGTTEGLDGLSKGAEEGTVLEEQKSQGSSLELPPISEPQEEGSVTKPDGHDWLEENKQLRETAERQEAQIASLIQQATSSSTHQEQLTSLLQKCQALEDEKTELTSALEELDAQHEAAIGHLLHKQLALSDEVKMGIELRVGLESELDSRVSLFEEERQLLILAVKEKEQQMVELQAHYELSKGQQVCAKELDSLKEDNNRLIETCMQVSRKEIDELREKCTSEASVSLELKAAKDELEKELQKLRAAQETNKDFESEITSLMKEKVENLKALHELAILLEAKENLLQSVKGERDLFSESVTALQCEQSEMRAAYDSLVAESNALSSTLTVEKSKLEDRLCLEEKKVHDLSIENQTLLLEVEGKNKTLSHSGGNRMDDEVVIQSAIDLCGVNLPLNWCDAMQELAGLFQKVSVECSSYKSLLEKLEDDNQRYIQEVETLHSEKANLERECEELHEQMETFECDVNLGSEETIGQLLPTIEEEEAEECEDHIHQISLQEYQKEHECYLEGKSDENNLLDLKRNLEAEIKNLTRQKEELSGEISDIETHVGSFAEMKEEAAIFTRIKEDLEEEISCLSKKLSRVRFNEDELKAITKERDSLLNEVKVLRQEVKSTEGVLKLSDVQAELVKTKTLLGLSVAAEKEALEEKEKLQTLYDSKRTQIIYKDDQIDSLSEGIKDIGEIFGVSNTNLRTVYVNVRQEYDRIMCKCKTQQNDIEELKEKIEELNEEIEELKENVRDAENDLESAKEVSQIHQSIQTEKEASSFGCQVSDMKDEMHSLEKELAKLSLDSSNQCAELETLRSKKSELETTVRAQHSIVAGLRERLDDASEGRNELMECISSHKNEVEVIKEELKTKEGLVSSLEAKVTELEALCSVKTSCDNERQVELNAKVLELQEAATLLKKEKDNASIMSNNLCSQMKSLQAEHEQMVVLLTQKHHENVTYHQEIQRLSALLSQGGMEVEQLKKVHELELLDLNKVLRDTQSSLEKCFSEVGALNLYKSDIETRRHLEESALIKEKEEHLSAECERLRKHLVAIEDSYTGEALRAKEREETLRSTLEKMEEKLSSNSNFYNSVSQKALLQRDILESQLKDITNERDDALTHLHAAEETTQQQQEALLTLQQVLEDFQKGQVRTVSDATHRERRHLQEEKERNAILTSEVRKFKSELLEVQSKLAASAQLQEEMQKKEETLVSLKMQVSTQEAMLIKNRDELLSLRSTTDLRVDKHLLRNLIVGYFATPSDKQHEVLRVIATVLDFSPEERIRTGLDTQGTSWLTSVANFLAPPASNVRVTSKVDVLDHLSLSQAFIRFLEVESSPFPVARLPAIEMAEKAQQKSDKKTKTKQNTLNPIVCAASTAVEDENSNSASVLTVRPPSDLLYGARDSLSPQSSPNDGGLPQIASSTAETSHLLTSSIFLGNLLDSESSH